MKRHLNFFGTVGRLPSSVVLDDDENRGDDVEAHATPSTQSSGGYQLLLADTVSLASAHSNYMARHLISILSPVPWLIRQ